MEFPLCQLLKYVWLNEFFFQNEDDAIVRVEPNSTFVICQGSERVRSKIRDALLYCLETVGCNR